MPGATLDAIDAALFTALSTLAASASPAGPFATVSRWAGDLPRPELITSETFGRAPAALLAFDNEVVDEDLELTDGSSESRGKSTWIVLVAVQDPRGAKPTLKGAGAVPGALKLAQQVQSVLNGLDIPATPALLSVQITGTANATLVVGGGRLVDGSIGARWTPAATTATFDAGGHATIQIQSSIAGSSANLANGAALTWETAPLGVSGSATVLATITPGSDGLLRADRVRCRGVRFVGVVSGQVAVLAVRFEAVRALPDAGVTDTSIAITRLDGNVNDADTSGDTPPNPLDTFRATY